MIAQHFEAVKALIPSRFTVYDTDAGSSPTFPYVVIWGGDFRSYSVDVAGSLDEVMGDVGVTCVAQAAGAARQTQSEVASILDGARITVPGRHSFDLVGVDVRPVLVDKEVQPLTAGGVARYPYYGVLTYRVETTEGSA